MLDSPPLPTIDKMSAPALSAQLVGLFAELIQGCSYLGGQIRSDVDELKARLANLEKAQDTSEPVKIEPENSEVTPLLSAHRQLLRAIVRNDIELVRRYVENAR